MNRYTYKQNTYTIYEDQKANVIPSFNVYCGDTYTLEQLRISKKEVLSFKKKVDEFLNNEK